jgi:hypothetical protein
MAGKAKSGFTVKLPPEACEMLERLKPKGIYGSNRAEIARTLILDKLKELDAAGVVRATD